MFLAGKAWPLTVSRAPPVFISTSASGGFFCAHWHEKDRGWEKSWIGRQECSSIPVTGSTECGFGDLVGGQHTSGSKPKRMFRSPPEVEVLDSAGHYGDLGELRALAKMLVGTLGRA